jgi:hypothetical protein
LVGALAVVMVARATIFLQPYVNCLDIQRAYIIFWPSCN